MWETLGMVVQLELPGRVADELRSRAAELHLSIQAVAISAIERDLARGQKETPFPVIRSASPGMLRSLTSAEIDELSDR